MRRRGIAWYYADLPPHARRAGSAACIYQAQHVPRTRARTSTAGSERMKMWSAALELSRPVSCTNCASRMIFTNRTLSIAPCGRACIVCLFVCVCACMRACVRACVHVRVRVCVARSQAEGGVCCSPAERPGARTHLVCSMVPQAVALKHPLEAHHEVVWAQLPDGDEGVGVGQGRSPCEHRAQGGGCGWMRVQGSLWAQRT